MLDDCKLYVVGAVSLRATVPEDSFVFLTVMQ